MLDSYTFKPSELPEIYRIQINNIIKDIVDTKSDLYWKNYTKFNIDEQTAISVSCEGDDVKVISSIYHRDFFGEGVYRLWNKFLYSKAVASSQAAIRRVNCRYAYRRYIIAGNNNKIEFPMKKQINKVYILPLDNEVIATVLNPVPVTAELARNKQSVISK